MGCNAAALGICQWVVGRHMWHVVVNFKDCTLTFNAGFKPKTIDYQVSLNRELTFWH